MESASLIPLPFFILARRCVLALALLGLLSGGAVLLAPPGALCLSCRAAFGADAPRLVLRQGLVWRAKAAEFGGISGLEMDQDGSLLLALSDQGRLFETRLTRDATHGTITALDPHRIGILLDRKGVRLSPFRQDAEDLALGPEGDLFVAFEGLSRIARYPRQPADPAQGHVATDMNVWNRFEPRFGNTGFEALLPLPEAALLVIAEAPLAGVDTGPGAPAFVYRDDSWSKAFDIPDPAGFSISSADIGPDGRIWLLERRVGLMGFVTRIRRFALHETAGQLALGPPETLLNGYLGPRDNFEGLSVWHMPNGCTIATLIADDGFSHWQRTAVAEFSLHDPEARDGCAL